jgi:hypothetical protein
MGATVARALRALNRAEVPMDLHELQEHWDKELGVAETFLPNEPMAALDATREIAAEIEREMEAHPESRKALSLQLAQARAALAVSHAASERWLAACAERARRWHVHELERAGLPMWKLRNPWPPRVSG